MPRNMSFAMTTPQFINRSKTVTRRQGWWHSEPGHVYCGVEKGMGLKKGEKINRLGLITVISSAGEPIEAITQGDVIKEGFPDWSPGQFIDFYCKAHKIPYETLCNRIEFSYIDLFRPLGVEGEQFIKERCEVCTHNKPDKPCRTLDAGLLFNIDNPLFPYQLIKTEKGGRCTEFLPDSSQRVLPL